jgi:hypothetical protein
MVSILGSTEISVTHFSRNCNLPLIFLTGQITVAENDTSFGSTGTILMVNYSKYLYFAMGYRRIVKFMRGYCGGKF